MVGKKNMTEKHIGSKASSCFQRKSQDFLGQENSKRILSGISQNTKGEQNCANQRFAGFISQNTKSEIKWGEAISIASSEAEKEKIFERYVHGKPEDITSKLAAEPVLRSAVLSLIASGFVRTSEKLFEFFESTFYGHQYKNDFGLQVKLSDVAKILLEMKFIQKVGEKLEPTKLGRRVSELYLDPLTAWHLICGIKKDVAGSEFSYLQLIAHTSEMRPLLRVRKKDEEEILAELAEKESYLLEPVPKEWDVDFEEFLDSVKTALMLYDWIEEKSEDYILDKYNVQPGSLRSYLTNADWLLYSCYELALLLGLKDTAGKRLAFQGQMEQKVPSELSAIQKTRLRVEQGIKEELLALVRLRGIGRYRARKLFKAGFTDLAKLKAAHASAIAAVLGSKLAVSVKEQLGQKVPGKLAEKKEVENGQKSLRDF